MNLLRISLCTMLLASPIPSLVLPVSVAQAETPVFVGGLQDLLPGEPSVADGSTQATYYFVLLNADGSPMEDVSGKTSLGTAKGSLKSEGNGLYSTILTPEAIASATNDFVQINARTADRKAIKRSFPVRLIPKASGVVTMTASPEEITLGQDDFVTINIQAPKEFAKDKFELSVSTGTVENLISLGNGQFSARYSPPTRKTYPHIAVFTLSSLTHPEIRSHLVVKQKGKANFAVNTNPNSAVIIRIDNRDFGPVQTDASGKASVPIVAPPGQPDATLIVISNEQRKEELLDLRIPRNVPRLNIVPALKEMPADGTTKQSLYVYVATAKGVSETQANLTCRAQLGTCGDVKSVGEGYYSVDYTPPLSNKREEETIQFILQDPSGDITDSETITVLPVLPSTIALKAAETVLPKNVPNFGLTMQVKDNEGKGLDDRNLIVVSNGAKLVKSPISLGSGDYTVKLSPTSDSPIEVTTSIKGSASTNPAFGIAMRANNDKLPNDGVSTSLLSFAVYDRFGAPIIGQMVEFELNGTGSLPTTAKTNSAGLAQVMYTAGTESGIVKIKATSGDLTSDFILFVTPNELHDSLPTIKRSQNQFHQRLQDRLFESINHIRFEREGMEGVALTGQVDKVGEPANIGLKAEPNKVAPGGKTTINISLTDTNGRGVVGEDLTVMSSSGSIGKLQDRGSGQYSVTLLAPDSNANSVTVVVESTSGNLRKELEVEIVGGSVSTTEPTVATTETTQEDPIPETTAKAEEPKPKKEKKPKKVKTPREKKPRSGDVSTPWLRASAGYTGGSFSYKQTPTKTDGLLYEKAITFDRQTEGASPALTAGVDVRAFGTIPSVDFLGFDVHVQADQYAISLSEFPEPIGDWMTSIDAMALGQYAIPLSGLTFTPSVRVGLIRDDLIVFRQDVLDDGNIALSYEPLFVSAVNVGIGTDIQTDMGIFAHVTYDLGLRGSIYRQKFDSQIGYDINGGLFGFLGLRSTTRSVDIETTSGKIGEIKDGNYSIVVGAGGAFR